jgi:predicted RNA binding protein YcfA (HicA-like mRNA interferase family)
MLAILLREPLGYEVARQKGSHRLLESRNGYAPLRFSFHDRATIPPGLVRKILMQDVGLTEDQARDLTRS